MASVKFGGDIAAGFGPNEQFGLDIVLGKIGEVVLDRVEPRGEVGMKLKIQRGWGDSQASTLGSAVTWLSSTPWITLPAGTWRSTALSKCTEFAVAMALRTAPDYGLIEHAERGEQQRPGLIGNPVGAVERLDLPRFFRTTLQCGPADRHRGSTMSMSLTAKRDRAST
jgi:hypothetical protein